MYPVTLLTKKGIDYFNGVSRQRDFCERNDTLGWFVQRSQMQAIKKEREIIKWLATHDMENETELNHWKEVSDMITVYQYFSRKK